VHEWLLITGLQKVSFDEAELDPILGFVLADLYNVKRKRGTAVAVHARANNRYRVFVWPVGHGHSS
jgi:hypothetical protein